ncbi:unnamed protein product, partial [Brachionus calyciflorus]
KFPYHDSKPNIKFDKLYEPKKKLVFNYMKNKRKFKDAIGAIKTDNATITDENKIAEIIYEYFKVQRRRLVKSKKYKTYEKILKILKLQNLEERRLRGELIQINKIINGVNFAKSLSLNIRRSNNLRLVKEINKRSSGRFDFLTNKIISTWNNLSSGCVSVSSVHNFEACIDREVFGSNRTTAMAQ